MVYASIASYVVADWFCDQQLVDDSLGMSAAEVIKGLKELPSREREKVLRWLQQQGLKDLWARADAVMKDAPKLNEGKILRLPRARPSGF